MEGSFFSMNTRICKNSTLYYANFLCLVHALLFLSISIFLMHHPNNGKLPAVWARIFLCVTYLNFVGAKYSDLFVAVD
jgi:hypothetical protein